MSEMKRYHDDKDIGLFECKDGEWMRSVPCIEEIAKLKELLNKECRYIKSDHGAWMQLACTPVIVWHEKTILKRKYIYCPYCGGKISEAAK